MIYNLKANELSDGTPCLEICREIWIDGKEYLPDVDYRSEKQFCQYVGDRLGQGYARTVAVPITTKKVMDNQMGSALQSQQLSQSIQDLIEAETEKSYPTKQGKPEFFTDLGWLTFLDKRREYKMALTVGAQLSNPVGGWISVEDRLPEERAGWSHSTDVNILMKVLKEPEHPLFVSTGSYQYLGKKRWCDYVYGERLDRGDFQVIAWQPLSEPPRTLETTDVPITNKKTD